MILDSFLKLFICVLIFKIAFVFVNSEVDENCVFMHDGYVFNFSKISDVDSWSYTTEVNGFNKVVYYFSLCHPIRNLDGPCGNNETASCYIKYSNDSMENNDTYVDAGKASEDGFMLHSKSIRYTIKGGQECNFFGQTKTNYETSIDFVCSDLNLDDKDIETGPMLWYHTDCRVIFFWYTKAACPVKMINSEGDKCSVSFSNSNDVLNLNALTSKTFYNVSSMYLLNICAPINDFDCGEDNSTVCDITDSESPVSIANMDDLSLNWVNGVLFLVYSSEDLDVSISFRCGRDFHDPVVVESSITPKKVEFFALSSAICIPKPFDCIMFDRKGTIYDLRSLYSENGNWEIFRTDEVSVCFYIKYFLVQVSIISRLSYTSLINHNL